MSHLCDPGEAVWLLGTAACQALPMALACYAGVRRRAMALQSPAYMRTTWRRAMRAALPPSTAVGSQPVGSSTTVVRASPGVLTFAESGVFGRAPAAGFAAAEYTCERLLTVYFCLLRRWPTAALRQRASPACCAVATEEAPASTNSFSPPGL